MDSLLWEWTGKQYQTAKWGNQEGVKEKGWAIRPANQSCTENGARTRTAFPGHWILSPARLPFRHLGSFCLGNFFEKLETKARKTKNASVNWHL